MKQESHLTNRRFQSEPLGAETDSAQRSFPSSIFPLQELVPLMETLFLSLHYRDWLTENEQAQITRLAPPAGYVIIALGD